MFYYINRILYYLKIFIYQLQKSSSIQHNLIYTLATATNTTSRCMNAVFFYIRNGYMKLIPRFLFSFFFLIIKSTVSFYTQLLIHNRSHFFTLFFSHSQRFLYWLSFNTYSCTIYLPNLFLFLIII